MLRPTSYLTVTLDELSGATELAAAVKRSYSYLAPTTIVKAASEGEGNHLTLDVRLPSHPFMDANDPASCETWSSVVAPWIATKLDTLFGTVAEFNNETRRSHAGKIDYATFTLVLEGYRICFHLEPDSSLRPCACALDAIRSWLASPDAHGVEVARLVVPSNTERSDGNWVTAELNDGSTLRIDLAE